MTNEAQKIQLKEYLLQEKPSLSEKEAEEIAASLLELSSFVMKIFLNHKSKEKNE